MATFFLFPTAALRYAFLSENRSTNQRQCFFLQNEQNLLLPQPKFSRTWLQKQSFWVSNLFAVILAGYYQRFWGFPQHTPFFV